MEMVRVLVWCFGVTWLRCDLWVMEFAIGGS
jgi:hypothetical protein